MKLPPHAMAAATVLHTQRGRAKLPLSRSEKYSSAGASPSLYRSDNPCREKRMTNRGKGRFLLSVDMGKSQRAAEQFVKRLTRNKIRATWGCTDLSHDFVTDLVENDQDVALLVRESGDRSWLADLLTRQVQVAHEMDVQLAAVADTGSVMAEHLDLLVRHRINVIRVSKQSADSLAAMNRFGISIAQPTLVMGDGSFTTNRWTVRRSVKKAVFNSGTLHVHLDLQQMGDTPVAKNFNHVLDAVEKQLENGFLKNETLSDLSKIITAKRTASRSILRAA